MRSFDIVIVTPNLKHEKTIDFLLENSVLEHEIYLIDNGASHLGFDFGDYGKYVKLVIPDCSLPLPAVYNRAWEITTSKFVAFLHNDVLVLEKGWDAKVDKYAHDIIGIIGFAGSIGLGSADIYKAPFRNEQLVRIGFHWNFNSLDLRTYVNNLGPPYCNESWLRCHGACLISEWLQIASVDGLAIIANRKLLDAGGFDEEYLFHGFDDDMCMKSIDMGMHNMIINVGYFHGGCGGNDGHVQMLKIHNKEEAQLHDDACLRLYNKWRHLLPIRY
jgi:hypothetical protein